MKKILSFFLVIILCFNVFSVYASAAGEDIVVSIGGGKAHQGGTITLPVTLDSNSGFTTLGIKISYDSSVLEIACPNHQSGKNCLPSIEKYNLISGNNGLNSQYHTVNPYVIQWAYPVVNGSITENVTKTGMLAKITFKVKGNAPLGETKVKVIVDQASEYDGTRCTVTGGEATVTVVDSTHRYDDECDAICNVCGESRTAPHKEINTETQKATLTANGYILKTCGICGAQVSKTTVYYPKTIALSSTSCYYNGKTRTPGVIVKDSNGKALVKGTDYTVSFASGRKNAGTYKVIVSFKGNYSGSKALYFKINPISATNLNIALSSYSAYYNGKARTPGVIVKDSAGKALVKGTDYTVAYASGRKNVGAYNITVSLKGNYSGKKTLVFRVLPQKTTVSKLVAGKRSATVYITKKSTQVTGYQVQYATNKSFSGAKTKTIKSYKTTKITLSSLLAKRYYYVRVRTYKTVSGKHYYSGWSTLKYVKTK